MDFISALDIIINDLKEAREIIDDLKNYPDVPLFQIELAKSKCKSAEEILSLLKTIKQPVGSEVPGKIKDDKDILPDSTPQTGSESAQPGKPAREMKLEFPEQKEKEAKPEKKTKPIFADTFGKASDRINEQLGTRNRDADISSVVKSKPVISLKDAIGLNDKFLYIRELFEGNLFRYEETIARLDDMRDLNEARSLILSLVDNDEENEVALQLIDLLKRKISSDG